MAKRLKGFPEALRTPIEELHKSPDRYNLWEVQLFLRDSIPGLLELFHDLRK